MYPKGRAKTRAGRFTMIADALDRKAKANPPPANAAGMLDQATEMRRMAQIADGISRARRLAREQPKKLRSDVVKPVRLIALVSLAALASSIPLPAAAQFQTGNQLLAACQSEPPASHGFGFCLGFVSGYSQGLQQWQDTDKKRCFFNAPAGVTTGQMVLVVKKFMATHPERLHEPAHLLVGAAMREAFPCK